MLVGADLYPCNRHTLSPPPRHLASGDASVTIRALLNGSAKYELRRMFSAKRVPLALRWVPGQSSRYFWRRVQQPIVDVSIRTAFEALGAGLCPGRNFALAIRWPRNSHGHK